MDSCCNRILKLLTPPLIISIFLMVFSLLAAPSSKASDHLNNNVAAEIANIANANSKHASPEKIVTLRQPSGSKLAQYIKALLNRAYQKIGYQIRYIDVAGISELPMAEKGRLSGALARFDFIEQQYPKLIRVPVAIVEFHLIKVANANLCGACEDSALKSVSYNNSVYIAKRYVEQLPSSVKRMPIANSMQLLQLLKKERIDAIYLVDSEIDDVTALGANLIVEQVDTALDYHYLSPSEQHLLNPLTQALQDMADNGEMQALKTQFGL